MEPSWEFPLRIGAQADLTRLESVLCDARFDQDTVCRILKISQMSDIGSVDLAEIDFGRVPEHFALFVRLFLFVERLPRLEVERVLDRGVLDSFLTAGLLRTGSFGGIEEYYTPVFFYPVAGFWIASDRHDSPDGSPFVPPPDIVFPAIFGGTLRFLRLIGKKPAQNALDLCSGSGIGAMVLSRTAGRAVSSDLTSRASQYAEFNSWLNRCVNVSVLQGDLYEAVREETFDRIVAHPPYMPNVRRLAIWRDGGETGEAVVRRIIEGLPAHLRPGGSSYILCTGLDTEEGLFEERARGWLGAAQGEFNVLFGFADERSPAQLALDLAKRGETWGPADIERLKQAFQEAGAKRIVYGVILLHRGAHGDRGPWTTRRRIALDTTEGSDFEWLLEWHGREGRPAFPEEIASCLPDLSPNLRVRVTHVVVDGSLVPGETLLETAQPFAQALKVDPWIAPLVAQFNGKRSPAEIYQGARAEGSIPQSFQLQDFVSLVAWLLERRCLDAQFP